MWLAPSSLGPADILITTPFHTGTLYPPLSNSCNSHILPTSYLTANLISKFPNLKHCVTAGAGSDHIDLNVAVQHNITVAKVSGSNIVSVAEHVMMNISLLVRKFVPAHEMVQRGDWTVSDITRNAFDLEGRLTGTIGAGG
jgi:formate dehydrogenase